MRRHQLLHSLLIPMIFSTSLQGYADDESPDLSSQFGMAVSFTSNSRPIDIQTRAKMGIRMVRRDVAWALVESSPGVFEFSAYDEVVDAELAAGVKVLGILNYSHPAYSSQTEDGDKHPPDDNEDFANYVRKTVAHFRGRINYWEVWNEPNLGLFWQPSPDPKAYAALLRVASAAVRETDPDAKVLFGGLAGGGLDFLLRGGRVWGYLEDVLAADPGILNAVDIMSIHPYTLVQYAAPEKRNGCGFEKMMQEMRRLLDENGGGEMPIWLTEYGWHNTPESTRPFLGVSEQEQAVYLVRASALALAHGAGMLMPYSYMDKGDDPTEKEHHFGQYYCDSQPELNQPPVPKPSAHAWRTMIAQLAPTRFVKDWRNTRPLGTGEFAMEFDGPEQRIVLAWRYDPGGKVTDWTLDVNDPPDRVIDWSGKEIGLVTDGTGVILPIEPTYLVWDHTE